MISGRCEYCGTMNEGETLVEYWRNGKPVPEEEIEEALKDIRTMIRWKISGQYATRYCQMADQWGNL